MLSNNSIRLNEIRRQCKWVTENADSIHINYDKIKDYAAQLPLEKVANPPLDPIAHYLNEGKATLAFFLTLETINFGSGYFQHLEQEVEECGYFTVATALANHYRNHGIITAAQLAQFTAKDCLQLFEQNPQNANMVELMGKFALALNQLGNFLLENFDGKFDALIAAARNSAERLVNILAQIPCFYDVAHYKNQVIPIFKRAQITAADLSLAFKNQGLGYFKDLDKLTIFADNMIPHVLRCDGIFEYEESLGKRIDRQELIEAGSMPETELRACSIHAIELIKASLNAKGHQLRSIDLDYLLWNEGLQKKYYGKHQLHFTRTFFY